MIEWSQVRRWAVLWRASDKSIYGAYEHIQWGHGDGISPKLFNTRAECILFIRERYGYISWRRDLREYPHGWLMPKPVRVRVALETVSVTRKKQQ